jgi:hypothetical protein
LSSAQKLQEDYWSLIREGRFETADVVWKSMQNFPAHNLRQGEQFRFEGVGYEGMTHRQYAETLESVTSASQRRYALRELQMGGGIRGYSAHGDPFGQGLTEQGEAAVARTQPGVGSKTEQAVERLVNGILQDAKAHEDAAKQAERDQKEISRARRSWRRAVEQEDTERGRDFSELDRRQVANVRNAARGEAALMQAHIDDLQGPDRRRAILNRMADISSGGGGGRYLPPGPNDPHFPEWQRLDRQLGETKGRGFNIPFGLYFQSMFGAWELSRTSAAIRRGEVEAAYSMSPIEAMDARLNALRSASGGIYSGIVTEGKNILGRAFAGSESMEKIEETTIAEKARRTDLDFVKTAQLQIAAETGSIQAFQAGGSPARRVSQIRSRAALRDLQTQTQIDDLGAGLDDRRDAGPWWLTSQGIKNIQQGIAASPTGTFVGDSGTYRLNNEGTIVDVKTGEEINPFAMEPGARAQRRQRIRELETLKKSGSATATQELRELAVQNALDFATLANQNIALNNQSTLGPREATRQFRRNQVATDVRRAKIQFGEQYGQLYEQTRNLELDITETSEAFNVEANQLRQTGNIAINRLGSRNMKFESGFARTYFSGQANVTQAEATQEPADIALARAVARSELTGFVREAFRNSRNLNRTNASVANIARLVASGDMGEASQAQLGEQESQELDQAGGGLFAALFQRPGIRMKYGVLREIARHEDTRTRGLTLQSLRDTTELTRLESVGMTGTAQAKQIRYEAEFEVAGLRRGPDYDEQRRLIFQRAANRAETLRRSIMYEQMQGSFEQVVGGTFAPQVTTRPWEEDRAQRLAAAQDTRNNLQTQAASTAPAETPLNVDLQGTMAKVGVDVVTAIRELITTLTSD